jgi:ATP-binding cassette, subfamily F, member 3
MLLLSCTDLARGYDANPLFEGVSFELHAGDRVGFVGPNGAGKTTLFRVIAEPDLADAGEVKLHAGARLGVLLQVAEFPPERTLFQEAKSAFDELLATQRELESVADELSHCTNEQQRRQLAAQFDRLNEILSTQSAYQLDHKVEEVLSGLGFREADYHRPIVTFSGGQQRRILLAKLLLSAPDVMLLDEPSNHLDIATTQWLEDYIVRQPQGMIIISHDRYLLNKVSTRTFELHNQRISLYPGNYNQYVRLRDERFEREFKEWESQQEFIEKQEEYIRRAHYGQLAKQAQSRMKALDKIEVKAKPTKVSGPNIAFREVSRAGDVVFQVEQVSKRFGDLELFKNLSFDLKRGKRLGIMGPNGCGKTTLLKMLLGDESPTSGVIRRGHLVFPGYLDQHLKLLEDDAPVIRAVWPEPDPSQTEQKMRDLLGSFGLQGEIVERPVKQLSGGERSRAALAKLTVAGANILILDEPTNHLDIWACDSLEEALKAYDGTVIVVSHDRYFLNRVVDVLIVMEPGRVEVVYGNYDTYLLLEANRQQAAAEEASRKAKAAPRVETSASSHSPAKGKRKRKYPFRKATELEQDIAKCEARISELENAMTLPEFFRDAAKLKQTMAELEAAKEKLPTLYEHWEEAVELNG